MAAATFLCADGGKHAVDARNSLARLTLRGQATRGVNEIARRLPFLQRPLERGADRDLVLDGQLRRMSLDISVSHVDIAHRLIALHLGIMDIRTRLELGPLDNSRIAKASHFHVLARLRLGLHDIITGLRGVIRIGGHLLEIA